MLQFISALIIVSSEMGALFKYSQVVFKFYPIVSSFTCACTYTLKFKI